MTTYNLVAQAFFSRKEINVYGNVTGNSGYFTNDIGTYIKTGVENPLYLTQIANKIDATTGYTRQDCIHEKPMSFDLAQRKFQPAANGYWYSESRGCNNVTYRIPNLNVSDGVLRDQALGKLYRKIRKNNNVVNSMVPIGELKDLASTVRATNSLTSDFFNRMLRAGDLFGNSRRKMHHWLAEAWLTYAFAIKPMASDFAQIADAIQDKLSRHPQFRYAASKSKPLQNSIVTSLGSAQLGVGWNGRYHYVWNGELRYKFVCGYDMSIRSLNDYSVLHRLGLDRLEHFIPTVWELIPWSWFIDYFTTIGECLDDTFTLVPERFIYFDEIVSVKGAVQDILIVNPLPPGVGYSNVEVLRKNVSSGVRKYFRHTRLKRQEPPVRWIRFKTRDEMAIHSGTKALNLLAILASKWR